METVNFVYNQANQIVCLDGNANGVCGDAGDVPYSYDAYGNLTSDGTKTYAYDSENRLISVIDGATTTTYTYNGDGDRMSQTIDGVTTSYVLDTATPLTMVLAESTGTETIYYLHGLDLVAQNDGVSTEYFGYDGLGSVRQMLDSAGSVLFAKVFDPYGNPYASAGTDSTSWGFTGEQTDGNGLIYLRARYYDPRQGRFLQRDTWQGVYVKPISLNAWLYANSNPVIYVDRSGHSSTAVECDKIWFSDMRSLCHEANGDDSDPNTIYARYKFFSKIAEYSKLLTVYNSGFWWAGDMLQHFLLKKGSRDVTLSSGTSFGRDQGIVRAIKEKIPAIAPDEPKEITPLLYEFLFRLKSQVQCGVYVSIPNIIIRAEETYTGDYDPRPYGMGWWGAFGHVPIDVKYSDILAFPTYGGNGYVIKTKASYSVEDKYEWFGGAKTTPLPLGTPDWNSNRFPPVHLVFIPHEWEDSLVSHGLASEYDSTLNWSEYMQVIITGDYDKFLIVGEGKWLNLE